MPDEANVALGEQLGSVYILLYFHCQCWKNDKLKSQWRELGFDIFDNTFLFNAAAGVDGVIVNKSVITLFFNQLVHDIASNLTSSSSSNDIEQIIDGICYWWIAILSHCEKNNRNDISMIIKK